MYICLSTRVCQNFGHFSIDSTSKLFYLIVSTKTLLRHHVHSKVIRYNVLLVVEHHLISESSLKMISKSVKYGELIYDRGNKKGTMARYKTTVSDGRARNIVVTLPKDVILYKTSKLRRIVE